MKQAEFVNSRSVGVQGISGDGTPSNIIPSYNEPGLSTTTLDPKKNTVDKKGVLRFDFLLSYWILVWFALFYFTPEKSTEPISKWIRRHLNPSLGFYFAFIENVATLLLLIIYNPDLWLIFKFISMIVILKVIPLYLLRNYAIRWKHDTLVFVVVFGIYNLYLAWNETNLYEIYERTITSIRKGDSQTPMYSLLSTIWNRSI